MRGNGKISIDIEGRRMFKYWDRRGLEKVNSRKYWRSSYFEKNFFVILC